MANKSFVVQYLIKAREQYSSVADKVRVATKKMRVEIKKARIEAKKFSKRTKEMATKARNWGAVMTTVAGFVAISLKNAARDAIETRSKFATVFRDMSAESETMANNLAKNFGLAGTKSRQLLADTGDLLTGFGFSQESALKLSVQVNELAVDLASFTNFSGGAEGASAALTKALLGERESLKSLGVAISEKDVKTQISKMLAQGQTFETLRQAKAQATLQLAIQQSGNAIGDFARTQGELANQERITSARIQDLKESMGKALLPIALKVTKAIRGMVEWVTNLSPEAKKAALVVAGIVAALGPLLLAGGSLVLIWPAVTTAFAAFGAVAVAALGPIGLLAAGIALGAVIVIRNWDKVKAFFKGFASAISSTLGPTITKLVDSFREAAGVIAQLFSSDGEASKNLSEFANIGELIGTIVGGALDLIIRGLSGIGEIIGQVIAAVVNMDFSNFDIEAIKAEFLGPQAKPILVRSSVDVGINVGLDEGLRQTGPAAIQGGGFMQRRSDIGVAAR